jgi:hypothetical protein
MPRSVVTRSMTVLATFEDVGLGYKACNACKACALPLLDLAEKVGCGSFLGEELESVGGWYWSP